MIPLAFRKFMPIVIAEQRKALEQYRQIRIYINPKHVAELKCDPESQLYMPIIIGRRDSQPFMSLDSVEIYEHPLVKEGSYTVMPDIAKMHPSDFWHGRFDETVPSSSVPSDTPLPRQQSDRLHD